jgi:hypothetical protein
MYSKITVLAACRVDGVRVHHWSGLPDVEPNSYWVTDAEEAAANYEETTKQSEAECVVLARVVLTQNGQATEEHFIAQTPPPNYQ